jgi:hypothetical protein
MKPSGKVDSRPPGSQKTLNSLPDTVPPPGIGSPGKGTGEDFSFYHSIFRLHIIMANNAKALMVAACLHLLVIIFTGQLYRF